MGLRERLQRTSGASAAPAPPPRARLDSHDPPLLPLDWGAPMEQLVAQATYHLQRYGLAIERSMMPPTGGSAGSVALPLVVRDVDGLWPTLISRTPLTNGDLPHLLGARLALRSGTDLAARPLLLLSPRPIPQILGHYASAMPAVHFELDCLLLAKEDGDFSAAAATCTHLFARHFSLSLDATPGSLKSLDDGTMRFRGQQEQRPVLLPRTLYVLGSYVGEVWCKSLKGRWARNGAELLTSQVVLADETHQLWPFFQVWRMLNEGLGASTRYFYEETSRALSEGRLVTAPPRALQIPRDGTVISFTADAQRLP